jgi:hypothetical protein
MLPAIQGIYRNGEIQLNHVPDNVDDETPVTVTFLTSGNINLAKRDINAAQADNLRSRLTTFAQEWDSPEMDVYDNYDAAKTRL